MASKRKKMFIPEIYIHKVLVTDIDLFFSSFDQTIDNKFSRDLFFTLLEEH
jgi:hypothetical protein